MADYPIRIIIDPTRAQAGTQRVEQSLRGMDAAATRTQGILNSAMNPLTNTTRAQAGLRQVSRSLGDVNIAATRTRAILQSAFSNFLGLAGFSAITQTFSQSIQTMRSFGQAISTVSAISSANEQQLAQLTETARTLGATTRFSATQAAEGMLFLARAGFDAGQVLESIEGTLFLAQAGALDLGSAADIASNILTGFALEVERTGHVADVLAFAANNANTNVQQLGDAMKFVAPIAAGLNVSMEEATAAISALSNAGLQASLAGTGLRRVLSELESPAGKTRTILSSVGLAAEDVRVSQVGLTTAIERLRDAGIDAGAALEIFGDRGGPAFQVLQNAIPAIETMSARLGEVDGYARQVAQVMDDNLNGAMLAVASASGAVTLSLDRLGGGSALTDGMRALATALRFVASNMDTIITVATAAGIALGARLLAPLGRLVLSFGQAVLQGQAMSRQLTFIRGAATSTATQIVALTSVTTVLRGVMAGLGGPLGLITLAGFAIYELSNNSREAQGEIEGLAAWLDNFNRRLNENTEAAERNAGAYDRVAEARRRIVEGAGVFDRSPGQLEGASTPQSLRELQQRRQADLGASELELERVQQSLIDRTRQQTNAQQAVQRLEIDRRRALSALTERGQEAGPDPTDEQRRFIEQDRRRLQQIERRLELERQRVADAQARVEAEVELVRSVTEDRNRAYEEYRRVLQIRPRGTGLTDDFGTGAEREASEIGPRARVELLALQEHQEEFARRQRDFQAQIETAGTPIQRLDPLIVGEGQTPVTTSISPYDRARNQLLQVEAAVRSRYQTERLEIRLTQGDLQNLSEEEAQDLRAIAARADASRVASERERELEQGRAARREAEVTARIEAEERVSQITEAAREVNLRSVLSEQDLIRQATQEQIQEVGRLAQQRLISEQSASNAIVELRMAEQAQLQQLSERRDEEGGREQQERAQAHAIALEEVQQQLVAVGLATRDAGDEARAWAQRVRAGLDITTEAGQEALLAIEAIIERQQALASSDLLAGLNIGIQRFAANGVSAAEGIAQATERAFDRMTDTIVQFVETGKLEFDSLIGSILSDLTRLAISETLRAGIAGGGGIFATLIGSFFGGLGGGAGQVAGGAEAFSGPVRFPGAAEGGLVGVPRFARGGEVVPSYATGGTVSGMPILVSNGEFLVNPRATRIAYPLLRQLNEIIPARASGGLIRGPGTGTSDSILMNASPGSFVVNARATQAALPFLQTLNDTVPSFQEGGFVARRDRPDGSSGDDNRVFVQVVDQRVLESSQPVEIEQSSGVNSEQQIRILIRDAVGDDLASGRHNRVLNEVFGVRNRLLRG